MLRSQSPYLATGVGEGLAGAAGAIEHNREDQLLDSKSVLRNDFPTFMWQRGDGTMVDSHIPNPSYDAKNLPREKWEYAKKEGLKPKWKPTEMWDPESGSQQYYDEVSGRFGWSPPTVAGKKAPGPLITETGGKPAATTTQPPVVQPPAQQPPAGRVITPNSQAPTTQQQSPTSVVTPGPIPGRATPTLSGMNPLETVTKVDPEDSLIRRPGGVERMPKAGVQTAREKEYIEIMKDARKHSEGADGAIAQLNRLEGELSKLPKDASLLSAGPGADKRKEVARWINYTLGLMGQPPRYDPAVVGAMEASFKDSVVGGFMQSRLTGGGQHNAAPIINMAIKAFPGADMTSEGARIIIAANKQAAQRERDRYAFFNDPENIKAIGRDPNALTAAFDRYNPVEMYAARARMSLIPPKDIEWYRQNPEKRAAGFDKTFGTGLREWIR